MKDLISSEKQQSVKGVDFLCGKSTNISKSQKIKSQLEKIPFNLITFDESTEKNAIPSDYTPKGKLKKLQTIRSAILWIFFTRKINLNPFF